jgi:hypothetical protein
LPVALAGKGSQGLTPVCEYLFFGSGHVKIRADGVGNVSWERGGVPAAPRTTGRRGSPA